MKITASAMFAFIGGLITIISGALYTVEFLSTQESTSSQKLGAIGLNQFVEPNAVIIPEGTYIVNHAVSFSGEESTPSTGATIIDYNWFFGDNHIDHGIRATHTYSTIGQYHITLKITDSNSYKAITQFPLDVSADELDSLDTQNITPKLLSYDSENSKLTTYVDPFTSAYAFEDILVIPPKAVISTTGKFETGLPLKFSAEKSSDEDGEIVEYRWDFGDGTSIKKEIDLRHTYYKPGIYHVILQIFDDDGAVGATSIFFEITPGVAHSVYDYDSDGIPDSADRSFAPMIIMIIGLIISSVSTILWLKHRKLKTSV